MNILFIFTFQMDLSLNVLFQFYCGSHKVYLNFWVTHFGGSDRVQIKVNMSMFGWDCPSPLSKVSSWCPLLVVPPYLCHLITFIPQYLLWAPADNNWAPFLCSLVDNCQTTSLFHRIGLSYGTSLELSSRAGGIQVGSSLTPLCLPTR